MIPGATTKTIAQTADTTPTDGISRFCGGVFGADDSTSTVAAYGSSSTEPGTFCSKFSSDIKDEILLLTKTILYSS